MRKRGTIISGDAVMILKDGTEMPFLTVTDLGLPTRKVIYHVDQETRQRWNDEMMVNVGKIMSDYYNRYGNKADAFEDIEVTHYKDVPLYPERELN